MRVLGGVTPIEPMPVIAKPASVQSIPVVVVIPAEAPAGPIALVPCLVLEPRERRSHGSGCIDGEANVALPGLPTGILKAHGPH